MRDLNSNTKNVWYALYEGKTKVYDENGDLTGDMDKKYSEPIKKRLNVSATRGTQGFTGTGLSFDYFGADIKYDRILSTSIMDLGIDEHTLVWLHEPRLDENGEVDYHEAEFRVTAVAEGLHHMKYAIRSRNTSAEEDDEI